MSPEEALAREAALLPAHYVNLANISMVGGQIRMAFGENSSLVGIIAGRCAIIMSPEDALTLAKMLASFVKEEKRH